MGILVTGGSGYIGSRLVKALKNHTQENIYSLDLREGDRTVTYLGNVGSSGLVRLIIKEQNIDTVFHLASQTSIEESKCEPSAYYNDMVYSKHLIDIASEEGVKNFIFASTAAVYTHNRKIKLSEAADTQPASPYAHSKLMTEILLRDIARVNPFMNYAILRYFNVGPGKGVIHKICKALAEDKPFFLNGVDWLTTPDGTAVRDYIHVDDVVRMSIHSMDYIRQYRRSVTFNCCSETAYSVGTLINIAEQYSGKKLEVIACQQQGLDSVTGTSVFMDQKLGYQHIVSIQDMIAEEYENAVL